MRAPLHVVETPYTPLVPSEHSTQREPFCTKLMNPYTLLNDIRPSANPTKTCVVAVRFHSPPNLIRWLPRAIDTLSSNWMRVS